MTSADRPVAARRPRAGRRNSIRFASGAALAALATGLGAVTEPVDHIVLRVNGEISTLVEYRDRRSLRIEQIAAASDLDVAERRRMVAEAGRTTMREIFDEMLVLSRARQLRIEVTPAQLDRAEDNAKRRFGLETDDQFTAALAQQGLTPESFRERMKRTLLFNQVVEQEVQSKIKIEDDDVARYWQRHAAEFRRAERRRVEEVLVRDDSTLDADARRALADDVVARAAAGATLAEAATAAAAGAPEAISAPIEHGWVERGALAPALDEAVFGVATATTAPPVVARGGLHVVRVLEIEPAAQRPIQEVEDEIRARLGEELYGARIQEFLAEQARLAYVVENLPEEAVGYRTAILDGVDPVRDLLRGDAPIAEPTVEPIVVPPAVPPAPPPPASEPPPAGGS